MNDLQPAPTIEAYRRHFSSAPIGTWTDCVDWYMGFGFAGLTGHFSETTFARDGKGRWTCRDETILFEWQEIGNRVVEVRRIETIPPDEGLSEEELEEYGQWHRVEYDFMILECINRPVVFDVESTKNPISEDNTIRHLQFLECFGRRFGGPYQLSSY